MGSATTLIEGPIRGWEDDGVGLIPKQKMPPVKDFRPRRGKWHVIELNSILSVVWDFYFVLFDLKSQGGFGDVQRGSGGFLYPIVLHQSSQDLLSLQ